MYINLLKLFTISLPFVHSNCTNALLNFEDSSSEQNIKKDYNVNNIVKDKTLNLILSQNTGGTRISLPNNVHYGIIKSNMKISHGSNIVSAFILMADNGDEIDFEFVGKDKTVVQTNYFYKGVPIYDKNAKFYDTFKDLSKTYNNYTIVWTPDYYMWKFNDITLRTLHKKNTTNFPDSPSKVQIGIWKAQNSKWAGNGINWSQQPFNISIKSLHFTCYREHNSTKLKSTNTSNKNVASITSSINATSTTSANNVTSTTNATSSNSTTSATTKNDKSSCAADITAFINNSSKLYNILYINLVMGIFYNIV